MGTSSGILSRVHDRRHPLVGEAAHQVVLEREVEPRLTGVALAPGASPQLVVDPARLVALGAQHVEPAGLEHPLPVGLGLGSRRLEGAGERLGVPVVGRLDPLAPHLGLGQLLGVAAELDVDAPTRPCWWRRSPPRTCPAWAMMWRLPLVLLGVEDLVPDPVGGEVPGQLLGLLDGDGADQDGLALLVALHDVGEQGVELGILVDVDEVGLVPADDLVRWWGSPPPRGRRSP